MAQRINTFSSLLLRSQFLSQLIRGSCEFNSKFGLSFINSINSFFYVSSMGANSNVSNSYLRNKGQVEDELVKLNFTKLAILRPSLLLGNRKSFRLGERIAQLIMTKISIIFIGKIKKFKPIKATDVAKAIINITKNNYKIKFFESDKLLELSKK